MEKVGDWQGRTVASPRHSGPCGGLDGPDSVDPGSLIRAKSPDPSTAVGRHGRRGGPSKGNGVRARGPPKVKIGSRDCQRPGGVSQGAPSGRILSALSLPRVCPVQGASPSSERCPAVLVAVLHVPYPASTCCTCPAPPPGWSAPTHTHPHKNVYATARYVPPQQPKQLQRLQRLHATAEPALLHRLRNEVLPCPHAIACAGYMVACSLFGHHA